MLNYPIWDTVDIFESEMGQQNFKAVKILGEKD